MPSRTPGEFAAYTDMADRTGRARERRAGYAERENNRIRQAISERVKARKAAEAAGIRAIVGAAGSVAGGVGGFLLGGPPGAVLGAGLGNQLSNVVPGASSPAEGVKAPYAPAEMPGGDFAAGIKNPYGPSADGAPPPSPTGLGVSSMPMEIAEAPEMPAIPMNFDSSTSPADIPAEPSSPAYDQYLEDLLKKTKRRPGAVETSMDDFFNT